MAYNMLAGYIQISLTTNNYSLSLVSDIIFKMRAVPRQTMLAPFYHEHRYVIGQFVGVLFFLVFFHHFERRMEGLTIISLISKRYL